MDAMGQRPRWDYANIVPVRGTQVVGQTVMPIGAAPEAATAPHLTYRGGPLIASVKVFALYWGSAWNTTGSVAGRATAGSRPATRQTLNAFMADLVNSAYIDLLAEYSTNVTRIGRGTFLGSAIIAPNPAAQVSDDDIQRQITQRIASGDVPTWDANTLYAVFLPSGTVVEQGGSLSCQTFCGYHNAIVNAANTASAYYAVFPYPDCSGCAETTTGASLPTFDALTSVISHEVAEAITDPIPGTGWYDDQNGENADICAWKLSTMDGYTVQQFWSNAAKSCVGPGTPR